MMMERVRLREFESKVMDPMNVVKNFIVNGLSIGFGGMGGQSVPKAIPRAIAELVEKENLQISLNIFAGGGGTPQFERSLSKIDVRRRYYYLSGNYSRNRVNEAKTELFDYWVGEYSRSLREGSINSGKKLDLTVIEATAIDNSGNIVPSLSVDASTALIDASKKLIIEINESKPILSGLHDIYKLMRGRPIEIRSVKDKIGLPYISVPRSKIAAIVLTSEREEAGGSYSAVEEQDLRISENIVEFLEGEYQRHKISVRNPIQLGAGPIASAVMEKLARNHLRVWSEITPAKWTESLGSKVDYISASAFYILPGEEKFLDFIYENLNYIRKHAILRPSEIANSMEIISRLEVVVLQQAIEIDIFGNANVSHINGKIYNGVGGSGEFTRAAKLTILVLPSTASKGRYSRIVPMLSNVDIPKQDIDVIITEVGIADLRGLSPRERATLIIDHCSNQKFKDMLNEYYFKALKSGGHLPFDFLAALKFRQILENE